MIGLHSAAQPQRRTCRVSLHFYYYYYFYLTDRTNVCKPVSFIAFAIILIGYRSCSRPQSQGFRVRHTHTPPAIMHKLPQAAGCLLLLAALLPFSAAQSLSTGERHRPPPVGRAAHSLLTFRRRRPPSCCLPCRCPPPAPSAALSGRLSVPLEFLLTG